jgi:DNA-binding transcriptional regulator YiaG
MDMGCDSTVSLGDKILQGLQEFTDALESGEPVSHKLTCRKVELQLCTEAYSPQAVKETRDILSVSQPLFASFLGTSTSAVQKWERGEETPPKMACRMMDEIRLCPDYWRKRLAQCLVPKADAC